MKFADLVFDKNGCCGSHTWAEVVDANGVKTQVYDNGDGTYNVVKMAGSLLLSNQQGLTQAQAEAAI